MVDDSESQSDGLRTLRPEYIESEHRLYVDWLNRALRKSDVRNIALSGPYGVGKSSILQGFRKNHPEAIFISLSTLGFRESKNHRSAAGSSGKGAVSEETNRIQKEIVKQLLYREAPNKLPASRFKRIHRMTRRSRIGASGLIGLAAALVMVTLGVMAKIPATPLAGWSSWLDFLVRFAGVWLTAASAALAASPLLEGRVHLDKITAGPTTISLSRDNDTYFDEYLDEIMYFFEVRRKKKGAPEKTIVVFEDIDRFDNAEIFEELRELNTLLNNAGQLNRRSRHPGGARKDGELGEGVDPSPIVFIYAMKDSIFDASSPVNGEEDGGQLSPSPDKAALEAERANRTKFFDLIIPVVPFVTHQSARDLMRQELCGVSPGVSDELINRVARYVPELRVIRSVCNEYRVYARRLLRKGSLYLKPDHLFAMMLYKAVHLRDYEDIRLGRSNLDTVYRTSLEVVERRIAELNQEYDDAEKRHTGSTEAEKRGTNFEELVKWAAGRQFKQYEELFSFEVEVKGNNFDNNQTKGCEFWSVVLGMAGSDRMEVSATSNSGRRISFGLSKTDLVPFTGERAITKSVESVSEDELNAKKKRIGADRKHYRRARMKDLMKDAAAEVPSVSKNDAKENKENGVQRGNGKCSFSNYVERALGSPLAAMLVRDGYIDENFILYTSVYHETSLSSNAMTFKVRHIERGEMNATYELSDDEVKNLLTDVESKELSRPGAYNIHILDYLLRSGDAVDRERLDSVVEGLLRNGDDERELLQDFFSTDARGDFFGRGQKASLVQVLAPRHAAVFTVLIGLQGVDDGEQRDYVDIALQYASGDIDYDLSALKGFIEDSFDQMKVFAGGAEEENRETVAELVKRSEAKLDDLSKVEEGLRELLIAGDCYAVNRPNLDAVAGAGGVSLDALASERPGVYSYVLGALDDYLEVIGGDSDRGSAIAGASGASRVITDVASLDSNGHEEESGSQTAVTVDESQLPSLKKVLDASNGEWTVDLRSVPNKMSWPMLAHYKRFTASVANLLLYVEGLGMDESLAELLEKQSSIEAQEQLSETDYIKLAGAVLGARDRLTAEKRVKLIASIGWDGFIPAETITPEKGELIGLLIKARLIADDEPSYELAKNLHDWPTKEFAIASSKRFPGSVDLVGDEVVKAIRSEKIGEEFKRYIIHHMNSSCTCLKEDQIGFAVDYAIGHEEFTLSAEALQWLPSQGVGPAQVVALMARTLNDMKDDDVCAAVLALGEPYAELLVPGSGQIRISGQKGHEELLERLKKTGSVSSFSLDEETHEYRVHRKRK